MKTKLFQMIFWWLLSASAVAAQTGGPYQIEKSTIASGGGRSSGGSFSVENTAGQAIAGGRLQGSQFAVFSGFLSPAFAATAASVFVSGRVLTPSGHGLTKALVFLTDMSGNTVMARTSSFGYYSF